VRVFNRIFSAFFYKNKLLVLAYAALYTRDQNYDKWSREKRVDDLVIETRALVWCKSWQMPGLVYPSLIVYYEFPLIEHYRLFSTEVCGPVPFRNIIALHRIQLSRYKQYTCHCKEL